jgi:glyoxylase-like metal-dependent hydrolase (beta-lactamase superfamily II)
MTSPIADWGDSELRLTDRVSVLTGADGGKYPSGNSILVRGDGETMIIDPSITVVEKGGVSLPVDLIVNSHSHEDHVAGNGTFPDAKVFAHHDDLHGVHSLDGLLDVFGYEGEEARAENGKIFAEEYHYVGRPDAKGFGDGHGFDLGAMHVEAMHLPGHTRGHSGFHIDGGIFFLSDIDLTGFGPYYGDVWSDLDQFDDSLRIVRDVEADWYITFHHKGIIEGRETFLSMLDGFHAVIGRRHDAMLEYLAEPHTIDEMVTHRFMYRPHVDTFFVNMVEKRTAELHIQRMLTRQEAAEVNPGVYQAI